MKRFIHIILALSLFILLTACGSQQNDSSAPSDDGANSNVQNQDSNANSNGENKTDMAEMMGELDYADFELEVSYNNDKEYEVEIEREYNTEFADAKIEDSVNDVYKKGEEAFHDLYPKVKKLSITQDTKKAEIVEQVLKAFDLPDDYTKFEVEITFKDKTKLEYEDRK
ncbi:YusW family protein [Lentibacillus sp. Marseille-P4043]|uniref:YusW family protein n=1 Tax=Lentibacillus sp. Marseille-P4043 TaxID=2040293 RepID=UPI000D0BD3F2|nr:YusW family protein [Lentibacillus sp. Marseille-P4043]